MSDRKPIAQTPGRSDSWLARVVERIQLKRAISILVSLLLLADFMIALSLWAGSSPEPVALEPIAEPWPTDAPVVIVEPEQSPTQEAAQPGTPIRTPTSRPAPTAGPTPSPLPLEPGDLNLLLLGTDMRQGADRSWRTDTIIVVAIRPRRGIVTMLSIPRDLWVTIPGYGENRINVADNYGERTRGPGGGPALLGATLQQNLGIPIHAYARINFAGVVQIVDALGGVTVTVERPFDEIIDDADGTPPFHLKLSPGAQRLDGLTALAYCRSRHGSSDMDRSRRQQQVLLAMRNSALRPEVLPRLPGLISALSGTVTTDVSAGQVLSLLQMALQLKPDAFRRQVFDYTMVRDWTTSAGAQVLLPNRARISQVWADLTTK